MHHTSPYLTAGSITFAVMLWTVVLWKEYGTRDHPSMTVSKEAALTE
jgi:hypothetical protein